MGGAGGRTDNLLMIQKRLIPFFRRPLLKTEPLAARINGDRRVGVYLGTPSRGLLRQELARRFHVVIPREIHQADSRLRPARLLTLINGSPLSHWMALGTPCCRNSLSNSLRTSSTVVASTNFTQSTYRLKASRTVSGSHRAPSRARHQPLKSTVHTSLHA